MTLDEFIKELQKFKRENKGSSKWPVAFEMERLEDVGGIEARHNQGIFVPDKDRKSPAGDNIDPKTNRPYTKREEISIVVLI